MPNIVWRGEIPPDTITVTECLGPNLKKLFMLMDKQFSISTISMIAIQVVTNFSFFLENLTLKAKYIGIYSFS